QELGVLGPFLLHDVLAVRVEVLRQQRVEVVPLASAVAVHHHDLGRAACLRAADGGVDLLRVELAAFFVECLAGVRLLGPDDPGDAFHVADDKDLHACSLSLVESGLQGKRVLVTGASGGIGSACARAFAGEGCDVVVHYHLGRERAEALAEELGGPPAVAPDLSDEAEADRLFEAAGELDVCAAVAGVWPEEDVPVWQLPLERWEGTLRAKQRPACLTARAFRRGAERSGHGSLVLVGSTAGLFGETSHADYAAAKSAI